MFSGIFHKKNNDSDSNSTSSHDVMMITLLVQHTALWEQYSASQTLKMLSLSAHGTARIGAAPAAEVPQCQEDD